MCCTRAQLLLAGLGFTNFAIEVVDDPYLRLFNEFLLLLSTIEFKFIITETLPEISYLTAMDFLVLVSLGTLFFMCIWHGCLAIMPLSHEASMYIDNRVIAGYGGGLLLALLVISLWIYFVVTSRPPPPPPPSRPAFASSSTVSRLTRRLCAAGAT